MKIILAAINAKYIHSSLAVYSLRAYLGEEEQKHVLIKEFTVNQAEDFIISELFSLKPDVLAFSCYIWNIEMVLSLAQTFKKILPDTKIIVGGPEVSYKSDDLCLFDYGIDIVVVGEGEYAFKVLVQDFLNKAPLVCANNAIEDDAYENVLVENAFCKSISHSEIQLKDIPFPYNSRFENFKNRIIYYESSRGCPFSCGFCLSSASQGVRFLPVDRVKEDLSKFLHADIVSIDNVNSAINTKIHQIKFVDRTFNCNKQHAMDIWSFLIQNDNGITNFHFEISGGLLDDEMINLIRQARKGLFQFEIGVQSTNPATLEAINRNMNNSKEPNLQDLSLQRLFVNIQKLKSLGNVHLHLDLIVGLPYEDYDSFIKSFNDVMSCYPHQLQVGFLKLLKGSHLRKPKVLEAYGIAYKTHAPYEILSNHFIDFEAINKLKKIEHMVELFYNSGGYQCFIRFMLLKFNTPFDFFDALSIHWEENAYHLSAHKKGALYTILYEFSKKTLPSDIAAICELLKFDMLKKENLRTFPNWITEYYHYDVKQITKTTGTHTFKYDICTWLDGLEMTPLQSLKKREIGVMFDYTLSNSFNQVNYVRVSD